MRIRAVLVATIVLVLSLPAVAAAIPPGGTFVDDDGSVHESAIEAIAAEGITRGCNPPTNDRYCPDDAVTRGQMAAFLVRAFSLTASDGGTFEDVPTGHLFATDISRLATAGITRGCNPPANDRYCPDDAVTREQMASFLARARNLPLVPVPPRSTLSARQVGSGFGTVTWVGGFPGDARLFAADTSGRIRVVGQSPGATVLDLSGSVSTGGERGLLGVAVHPSGDGRLVVSLTDPAGASRIVEYRWDGSVVDPASARLLLRVAQPATNHNGGGLAFDDAGTLFVALGDGGGGGDPYRNGQDPSTLLGSVLRVVPVGDDFPADPNRNYRVAAGNPFANGVGGDPAVWLWGVRNPWRIHLHDGMLYVADVGQSAREEVTVVAAGGPGGNLGWNRLEGTRCYDPPSGCSTAGTILPTIEYTHADGCSITGGVVLTAVPEDLVGTYLYADFCSGWVRSFVLSGGAATRTTSWSLGPLGRPTTFGVGPDGTAHLGTSDGRIWEIAP